MRNERPENAAIRQIFYRPLVRFQRVGDNGGLTTGASVNFFEKLKKSGTVKTGAKPILSVKRAAVTVDTVRSKIIDALHANKQVLEGTYTGAKEPVKCYKLAANGTYSFSIKYGVRNLEGVLAGDTYFWGLTEAQLKEAFAAAVELINSGACDKEIERVMAVNKDLGAKRK